MTNLARYSSLDKESKGRFFPESESSTRTCFQRDRDRIIHSTAFRRLEYKTQVFVNHEGDHYRTRLTHSLEVAQVARSLARSLNVNEDLAETLALSHDLGHTPFGHAGENSLSKVMQKYGGFDHNSQSLAVVTRLERRYPSFDGLNLTWETLEGLVKHNGPLGNVGENKIVSSEVMQFSQEFDLELDTYAGIEAQIAAISDDIAYNNHDLDDGLRAGLFSVRDLNVLPEVGKIFSETFSELPDVEESIVVHESIRRLIGNMITDCLIETKRRLREFKPNSAKDVRDMGTPIVGFSGTMLKVEQSLKEFLGKHMYRHDRVTNMTNRAKKVVEELFITFFENPDLLPIEWQRRGGGGGEDKIARSVADYIAGMTDRFAFDEHSRLELG